MRQEIESPKPFRLWTVKDWLYYYAWLDETRLVKLMADWRQGYYAFTDQNCFRAVNIICPARVMAVNFVREMGYADTEV